MNNKDSIILFTMMISFETHSNNKLQTHLFVYNFLYYIQLLITICLFYFKKKLSPTKKENDLIIKFTMNDLSWQIFISFVYKIVQWSHLCTIFWYNTGASTRKRTFSIIFVHFVIDVLFTLYTFHMIVELFSISRFLY